MAAKAFCAANWAYSKDYSRILDMLGKAGFLPTPDSELAGAVDIGLRRSVGFVPRLKNVCASAFWFAGYVLFGRALRNLGRAIYRYAGAVRQV